MTKTVFFDLDGTLTNSKKGIINALNYSFDHMQRPNPGKDTLQKFIGPALPESLKTFTDIQSDADIAQFIDYFHVYYDERGWRENEVFSGIPEMLALLQNAGLKLAIATAKPEVFAKRISDYFNFTQYLIGLTCATDDERTRTKKVDIVAYGLKAFDIAPGSDVAMVGDRLSDIDGGRGNQLHTVGVLYGFGSKQELTAAKADLLVPSVAALGDALLDWAF